jgi:hypothetical protein
MLEYYNVIENDINYFLNYLLLYMLQIFRPISKSFNITTTTNPSYIKINIIDYKAKILTNMK